MGSSLSLSFASSLPETLPRGSQDRRVLRQPRSERSALSGGFPGGTVHVPEAQLFQCGLGGKEQKDRGESRGLLAFLWGQNVEGYEQYPGTPRLGIGFLPPQKVVSPKASEVGLPRILEASQQRQKSPPSTALPRGPFFHRRK